MAGRNVDELTEMLTGETGYERRLDMMLRLGPYGDAFGARPDGSDPAEAQGTPHGVDLGPLQPRLPGVLRTPSGKVELAPEALVADAARLRDRVGRDGDTAGLVLIGRRHLRSNNSWMHNMPALAGGTNRCTLHIHPDDAARLGIDGVAVVKGAGGEVVVPVEVTDGIRPGVVSLPHGWGHGRPAPGWASRRRNPARTSTNSTTVRCWTRCRAPPCSTACRSRCRRVSRSTQAARGTSAAGGDRQSG